MAANSNYPFHFSGKLVAGEIHSDFEILDTNNNNEIDLEEMKAGILAGREQCETLRMIDTEHFSQLLQHRGYTFRPDLS